MNPKPDKIDEAVPALLHLTRFTEGSGALAVMKGNAAFQITREEWNSLKCQIGTLKTAGQRRHGSYLPKVFTEHGALMAATILNSERAVAMRVLVATKSSYS
jgi:hypothetical protein